MPKWTAQFNKAEDTVLGITWYCAIVFSSWITWKLLFQLTAASQNLPPKIYWCFLSFPEAHSLAGKVGVNYSSFLHYSPGHGGIHALLPKPQGCCKNSIQGLQPEDKISLLHSQAQTEQEFRWGFQARPLFFFFFHSISFQHQFLLSPWGTKLWGPFIANSNCKLHDKISLSIVMESFIIINLSIGRKGKKQENPMIS